MAAKIGPDPPGSKRGGPKTAAGKARASRNALRHGILSRDLLLPEEDAAEYRQLLDNLIVELRPEGTLELTLVERIAVAIWRQRRLVRVESARIQVARQPGVVDKLQLEKSLGENSPAIDRILQGVGADSDRELAVLLAAALDFAALSPIGLQQQFPRLWQTLVGNAGGEAGVDAFLQKHYQGSLRKWLLHKYAHTEMIREARENYALHRLANSLPAAPELISRYQAALDADLYKAMRALREAQRYRMEHAAFDARPVIEGQPG